MATGDIRMNILSNATIAISKGCKSMRGPAIFSVLSSPANWSGAIVDILSRVNTERFPLSLRGLPASSRCASSGFRPSRSYHLSTGSHGLPSRQNISCCVDITIMVRPAHRTYPISDRQIEVVEYILAVEALFTGWVPAINLNQRAPVPLSFVFKLAQELAPSNIANRLGEGTVLHHIFNR